MLSSATSGGIALCFTNLGGRAEVEGDYSSALSFLKRALLIQRDLRDLSTMSLSLLAIGYVACAVAEPVHAARIWGRRELLREEIDAPVHEADRLEYNEHVAAARAAARDYSAVDAAWMEGRAITVEQAIEYVLNELPPS